MKTVDNTGSVEIYADRWAHEFRKGDLTPEAIDLIERNWFCLQMTYEVDLPKKKIDFMVINHCNEILTHYNGYILDDELNLCLMGLREFIQDMEAYLYHYDMKKQLRRERIRFN